MDDLSSGCFQNWIVMRFRSVAVFMLAVLLIIFGILFAVSGRVIVAKLLFEEVDRCRIGSNDMTIRLYLGSFGATTAYTQIVTVQDGRMFDEQIVFSSYGGIPIESLACNSMSVTFVGEQNWSFTQQELRTQLVDSPMIIEWGKPISVEDSLSWDPFRLLCGGPLLTLGFILLVYRVKGVWKER